MIRNWTPCLYTHFKFRPLHLNRHRLSFSHDNQIVKTVISVSDRLWTVGSLKFIIQRVIHLSCTLPFYSTQKEDDSIPIKKGWMVSFVKYSLAKILRCIIWFWGYDWNLDTEQSIISTFNLSLADIFKQTVNPHLMRE
jgi:hypothetical protein